jgi:hypothetical protein
MRGVVKPHHLSAKPSRLDHDVDGLSASVVR